MDSPTPWISSTLPPPSPLPFHWPALLFSPAARKLEPSLPYLPDITGLFFCTQDALLFSPFTFHISAGKIECYILLFIPILQLNSPIKLYYVYYKSIIFKDTGYGI